MLQTKAKAVSYLVLFPLLFFSMASYGIAAMNKVMILTLLLLLITQVKTQSIRRSKITILMILVYIIGIFSLWNSGLFHVGSFLNDSMFILLLLISNIFFYKQSFVSIDFRKLFFKFLEWSLYIHLMYITILLITGHSLFNIDYNQFRFTGSMGSSATSIYYLALFIPFFIKYLYFKEKKYLLLSIFLTILILLCGTRITILALMFIFMINIVTNISGYKKVIFFIIFIIASVYFIESIWDRLFFNGNVSIEGLNMSGRNLLWSDLINKFQDSPWFGFGTGSTYSYLKVVKPLGGVGDDQVHNDYIKIMFNFGVVGSFLFLYTIKTMFDFLSSKIISSRNSRMNAQISKNYIYGFMILMLTDNVLVYIFYIYPFLLYYFYTVELIRKENRHENSYCN